MKTEGIRGGALREREHDWQCSASEPVHATTAVGEGGRVALTLRVRAGPQVKWCRRGEYLISLGVPHGWDFRPQDFYESLYNKTKRLMAGWHDVERMSPHGSAMIANNMVYSRFRYWANTLCMPANIRDAIDSDV